MPITPAFTKLQRSIITSSIWLEDGETRLVWITLLAICDRDGIARVSDKMLAHTARVSEKGCEVAIKTLMAPDPDSRDRGDGRRIDRVPGGFFIINYLTKLSEGMSEEQRTAWRVQKSEYRAKKKANGGTIRVVRQASTDTPQSGPEATVEEINDALRASGI